MSSLLEYIRALNPVNERRDVLASLTQLEEELVNHTLPAFITFQETIGTNALQSQYGKQLTAGVSQHVNFQGNPIPVITAALHSLQSNIDYLEKETKRLLSFQFSVSNLTYRRLSLIRYIEAAMFFVRYARKMALRLATEEAGLATGGKTTVSGASKATQKWMLESIKHFAGLIPAIHLPTDVLKKRLESASDALIDEDTLEIAQQSLGVAATDPLNLARFSPTDNWFFSLGKALAEWKVKRYQDAKEEHRALQLRVQEWKELQADGHASPKLQQLIAYTEGRIEKLDYQIAQIEAANRY